MDYKVKNLSDFELEISVNLSGEELKGFVFEAEKELSNDLKLKGFRPGKVPHKVAKDYLDGELVSKRAFDIAVQKSFVEFLEREKLELIETSKINVKENTKESLIYSVKLIVYPKLNLQGYTGIKVKKNPIEISDKEVSKALEELYQLRNKKDGKDEKSEKDVQGKIDDEFAKSTGNFKDLEGLKVAIKESLGLEKKEKEKNRVRMFLLKEIADSVKVKIPEVLINRQLDMMIQEFDGTLHKNNMELSVYLAGQNKTQDDLKKEWLPKAEEKIKAGLILKEVAKLEDIKVEPEEVKIVVNDYLSSFGEMSPQGAKVDPESLKENVYRILINDKVLSFLESKVEYY